MIIIDKIYIETDKKSKLIFEILVDGERKDVYYEVENEYAKYLCTERCDAIVIGLLNWAMRNKHDIKSNIPITENLLYNIEEYLIPTLVDNDKRLYKTKIDAPIEAEPLKNDGGVGTGASGGVDSFYTILSNLNNKYKGTKITHLCINSVGSFHAGYKKYGIDKAKEERYEDARIIAKELNLNVIVTDSNIAKAYHIYFGHAHTYYSMFAVYCMQKLWKTYFYASTYDYGHYNVKDNTEEDSAKYELLSLNAFSNRNLKIYSDGASKTRLEKTQYIADFPIVQEHLHVCWRAGHNCGKCPKCKRTLTALYALGKLDKFSKVFDVKHFYKHKKEYLAWLVIKHFEKDFYNEPTYQLMKKNITLFERIIAIHWYLIKPLVQSIFSVRKKSDRIYKVITILGFKIKLRLKNNEDIDAVKNEK